MHSIRRILVLVVSLVAFAATSNAQESKPPTAEQIVDRYIEAIGGEMALRSIETLRIEGTSHGASRFLSLIPEAKADKTLVLWKDGLRYCETKKPDGIVFHVSGFDGSDGWSVVNTGGAIPETFDHVWSSTAEQVAEKQLADHWGFLPDALSLLEISDAMTVEGSFRFRGQDTWKVTFQNSAERNLTRYFDKTSGLVVGVQDNEEYLISSLQWSEPNEMGLRFPVQNLWGKALIPQRIVMDKIEVNSPILDSEFERR